LEQATKTAENDMPKDNGTVDMVKKMLTSNIAKGVYSGAGAASLISILRAMAMDKERKNIYTKPNKTDKDTLVLTLPSASSKYAEADEKDSKEESKDKPKAVGATMLIVKKDKPVVKATRCPAAVRGKIKTGPLAKVTEHKMVLSKEALNLLETRPYQEAIDILKVMGGGVLGYKAVEALYNKIQDRQLKKDEEAARTEFLDALSSGSVKRASAKEGMDKEATGVMSILALLSLLGTGASAYTTKRMLDSKFKDETSAGYNPPRVKRIVLKTRDDEPGEEIEPKTAQLAVAVKMAEISNSEDLLIDGDILKQAQDAGMADRTAILDSLKSDIKGFASKNPELVNSIISRIVKLNPSLGRVGFADRLPKPMRNMVTSSVGTLLKIPGLGGSMRNKAIDKTLDSVFGGSAKTASLASNILASFIGSRAAEQPATPAVEKELEPTEVKDTANKINIDAEEGDEAADAFLDKNRNKLRAVVRQMISEGVL